MPAPPRDWPVCAVCKRIVPPLRRWLVGRYVASEDVEATGPIEAVRRYMGSVESPAVGDLPVTYRVQEGEGAPGMTVRVSLAFHLQPSEPPNGGRLTV